MIDDKCRPFTTETQKSIALKRSMSKTGVQLKAIYTNDGEQVKRCGHGYRLLLGKRLNKQKKRHESRRLDFYTRMLIQEGYDDFKSLADL